ncbi:carbonic anhydrase, putative [Plasmodium malariae]|uniref:Carbonic anhydrase, putative n=1 Tax=Plasmodium malariae TaxID=5858 RepID=A0A1C3KD85_PLAMA|nr:carbonic anhydrase, putative [Plasmodium malariae]
MKNLLLFVISLYFCGYKLCNYVKHRLLLEVSYGQVNELVFPPNFEYMMSDVGGENLKRENKKNEKKGENDNSSNNSSNRSSNRSSNPSSNRSSNPSSNRSSNPSSNPSNYPSSNRSTNSKNNLMHRSGNSGEGYSRRAGRKDALNLTSSKKRGTNYDNENYQMFFDKEHNGEETDILKMNKDKLKNRKKKKRNGKKRDKWMQFLNKDKYVHYEKKLKDDKSEENNSKRIKSHMDNSLDVTNLYPIQNYSKKYDINKTAKTDDLNNNVRESFLYSELKNVDYSEHGNNWNIGMCKRGRHQSPVDLHLHGLKERELKNITDVYLNLFYDDDYAWNNYNKPWMKGDIFYFYEYLIKKLVINRKDNMFQIKAANNGITPFGVLFTTDEPSMFYADQIHFHSPSEHTFEGSGNRREIEMQIFHNTNDSYEYDEEVWNGLPIQKKTHMNNNLKNNNRKEENNYHSYIITFLMNSLSNQQLQKKYSKRKKKRNMKKQYQVISVTFTSAEINKSTITSFEKLPSEKFLRTILNASRKVLVGSEPMLVQLDEELNLNSLMMMLNIEDMEFLAYHGSSTLPECEENVHWKVAKQALPVSTETILNFYKMLKKNTSNYKGSENDNYRNLKNVQDDLQNYGKIYIIQGFPIQVLISSALSTYEDKEIINIIKEAYIKSFSSYIYLSYFVLFILFL